MDMPTFDRTFGELVKKEDSPGLKALVAKEKHYALAYQYNPLVQEAMRGMAGQAAMRGDRELVFFFVEQMGVPVNYVPPCTTPNPSQEERVGNSRCTPLIGATLREGTEDLALDLLAVPGQGDLDLGRDLGDGFTVLASAARSGAARVVKELLTRPNVHLREEGHSALCNSINRM